MTHMGANSATGPSEQLKDQQTSPAQLQVTEIGSEYNFTEERSAEKLVLLLVLLFG